MNSSRRCIPGVSVHSWSRTLSSLLLFRPSCRSLRYVARRGIAWSWFTDFLQLYVSVDAGTRDSLRAVCRMRVAALSAQTFVRILVSRLIAHCFLTSGSAFSVRLMRYLRRNSVPCTGAHVRAALREDGACGGMGVNLLGTLRLTLVKSYNMAEVDDYAALISRGMSDALVGDTSSTADAGRPDFVEIKAVTYCGVSPGSGERRGARLTVRS